MLKVPPTLSAKGIATLFGITEQRVSQLKRRGILTPGTDNRYSVEQAKQARGMQMSEHGARVIAQEYSNGTGKVAPAKVVPITNAALSEEDRKALDMDAPVEVDPLALPAAPTNTWAGQQRISELREKKLQAEVDRANIRARREAGELIERVKVQSSFVAAGALVGNILQNLPTELSSIFGDPETKAEVRRKVQDRIDQVHHALYTALKGYGEDDPA